MEWLEVFQRERFLQVFQCLRGRYMRDDTNSGVVHDLYLPLWPRGHLVFVAKDFPSVDLLGDLAVLEDVQREDGRVLLRREQLLEIGGEVA